MCDIHLKSNHNIGTNTVCGYHRNLKKVLNDAVSMDKILKNADEKIKVIQGVQIVIF
jgi:hypothetical protein